MRGFHLLTELCFIPTVSHGACPGNACVLRSACRIVMTKKYLGVLLWTRRGRGKWIKLKACSIEYHGGCPFFLPCFSCLASFLPNFDFATKLLGQQRLWTTLSSFILVAGWSRLLTSRAFICFSFHSVSSVLTWRKKHCWSETEILTSIKRFLCCLISSRAEQAPCRRIFCWPCRRQEHLWGIYTKEGQYTPWA